MMARAGLALTPAALDRLAATVERRMLRTLLEVLERVRAGLPLATVERALLARNVEAAIEALGLEPVINALYEVKTLGAAVRAEAWTTALAQLPAAIQRVPLVQLSLAAHAAANPAALEALARQDLRRIQQISQETEEAIRQVLVRSLAAGLPPREVARQLRPIVGLNRNQAAAVQGFRRRLEAEGREAAQIDRMVARKGAALLATRAENIALTETMTALNSGQRLQWDRLRRDGTISGDDWEREWVTADDERTCPQCVPFDGVRAPIGGYFVSQTGETAEGPPIHPRCRCIERLVLRGFRETHRPRRGLLGAPAPKPAAPTPGPKRRRLRGADVTSLRETAAEAQARVAFEAQVRPARLESAFVRLRDGTEFRHTSHLPDAVAFTNEQLARMANARLLTHNHPGGSSLSSADLGFAVDRRLRYIRAVGHTPDGQRVTYETDVGKHRSFRLADGTTVPATLIGPISAKLRSDLSRQFQVQYFAMVHRGVPRDEAARRVTFDLTHEVMTILARQLGFRYRRVIDARP